MNFAEQQSLLSSLVTNLPVTIYQRHHNKQWTMIYISDNCLPLTGYHVKDLLYTNDFSYGNLIEPRDKELVWEEIQVAIASRTEFNLNYRINHKSGSISWVWERGQGVYSSNGELLYLEGFIIDITKTRNVEQQQSLLLSLTKGISSAINFETALIYTLQQICTISNWDFGEAWLPDQEKKCFSYCTAWFPKEKNHHSSYQLSLAEFQQKSFNYKFDYDQGLPGKAWANQEAVWFCNLSQQPLFLRRELAQLSGLETGLSIPILAGEEVVAILVFFSRHFLAKDQDTINLLQTVGYQLGHLFRYKQIKTQLLNSKRELSTIIDSNLGIFFRLNYDGTNDYISGGCESLIGYSAEELLAEGKINLSKFTHPLDLETVSQTIKTSLAQGVNYNLEYRIFTKDNQEKWVWERGKGIFDSDDNLLAIEGVITDISERKYMEKALSESEDKYRLILENTSEGIFEFTMDGYYLCVNKALAKIYGYDNCSELITELNHLENGLYVNPQRKEQLIKILKSQESVTNFESQVYHRDGKIIWISENVYPLKNVEGEILSYEGNVEDITDYKKAQQKLQYQTLYDQLTDLPNRHLFIQYLHKSINRLKHNSTSNYQFSVLLLNCDRFKDVNNSLGHSVGDVLLVAIAERLKKCTQEHNIVARLGGDEFTIFCDDIKDIRDVIALAEKINLAFQSPFVINQHQLFCDISIGIFFTSSIDSHEYQKLTEAMVLQYASTALYKAKSNKRGYYHIFEGDMHNEALANLQLENEIRQGLERKEFLLYYQPVINLIDNQIQGFESLIRWNHPHKGITTPHYFLELAEKTGLIIPMSYWVLRSGCEQLKFWHQELSKNTLWHDHLPTLNINLSAQEFSSDNFLTTLDQIISETEVNPEYLRLEITENSFIFEDKHTVEILEEIVARKIQLWVDDFGTGYSNLSYLHRLPIQGLKVDRYFVREIENNTTKAKMIKGILSLAEDLDLQVVIEGVETPQQLKMIQEMGGKFAQGYLFSHPIPNLQAFNLLN